MHLSLHGLQLFFKEGKDRSLHVIAFAGTFEKVQEASLSLLSYHIFSIEMCAMKRVTGKAENIRLHAIVMKVLFALLVDLEVVSLLVSYG